MKKSCSLKIRDNFLFYKVLPFYVYSQKSHKEGYREDVAFKVMIPRQKHSTFVSAKVTESRLEPAGEHSRQSQWLCMLPRGFLGSPRLWANALPSLGYPCEIINWKVPFTWPSMDSFLTNQTPSHTLSFKYGDMCSYASFSELERNSICEVSAH